MSLFMSATKHRRSALIALLSILFSSAAVPTWALTTERFAQEDDSTGDDAANDDYATSDGVLFLGGRLIAYSGENIEERSKISRDITAMRNANSTDEALDIYTNGRNVKTEKGKFVTLEKMATAGQRGLFDYVPEYQRFLHALTITKEGTDPYASPIYADVYVRDHIDSGKIDAAGSAALSMALWMTTVHKLYASYMPCMSRDTNQSATEGSLAELESAMAYYIGIDQTDGEADGHSLYAMAQRNADAFGTLNDDGEADANWKIVDMFNRAQDLMQRNDPDESEGTCLDLRHLVHRIISEMTIPLLQELIKYMHKDVPGKVREYALAVVPLIDGCNPADYDVLFDTFVVDYEQYSKDEYFDVMLDKLEGAYPCLGITCEQVGAFKNQYDVCENPAMDTPIAGYVPQSDVRHVLMSDLDLLQIKNFVEVGADALAEGLYTYGRHVKKGGENGENTSSHHYRTIQHMTTTSRRKIIPYFDEFIKYFEGDEAYADDLFMSALQREELFANASDEQVTVLTSYSLQYMATHMYILQLLYHAMEDCQTGDGGVKLIDEAWAILVGSIEGEIKGGYMEGQGIYGLSKDLCLGFDTCTSFSSSEAVDDLFEAFQDVQEATRLGDCDELTRVVQDNIEQFLLTPLIQGALKYAAINAELDVGTESGDLAAGFVLAQTHVPLIDSEDPDLGKDIARNMHFFLDKKPVPDGADFVFDTYADAVTTMDVDCSLIGIHVQEGDLCQGSGEGDGAGETDDENDDLDGGGNNGETDDENDDLDGITTTHAPFTDTTDGPFVDTTAGPFNEAEIGAEDTAGDEEEDAPGGDAKDDPLGNFDPSKKTKLLGGRIVTSKNVLDRAIISRDHQAMMEALENGDVPLAREIYRDGQSSKVFDKEGKWTGDVRTFQDFSVNAQSKMKEEPVFNTVKYGLQSQDGLFLALPVERYADSFIAGALENAGEKGDTLAAEAVVALNLWMFATHELEAALFDCRLVELLGNATYQECTPSSTNDPIPREDCQFVNVFGKVDIDDGALALDEFAAYYIGYGQEKGDQNGPLLYALAEKTAEAFGTMKGTESIVNDNIMKLWSGAHSELDFKAGACTKGSGTYGQVRTVVENIKIQMIIPLMQSLIQSLMDGDKRRTKLYALSVVPQIAGCSPSTHKYLHETLIEGDFDFVQTDRVIATLESTYKCLRITCADVGSYKGSDRACEDPRPTAPIAGYRPLNNVRQMASLDLDIHQMDILMEMGATAAAKDLYLNGRNSRSENAFRGLQRIATDHGVAAVPQYPLYRRYFGNDRNYADSFIMDIFESRLKSPYHQASLDQKRVAVLITLQTHIMSMFMHRALYMALSNCESADPERKRGTSTFWDEAVALFVGSMEGEELHGSQGQDGVLLYSLGKVRCPEFDTCSGKDSTANDKIMSLFTDGQEDAARNDCAALEAKIRELEPLFLVPLIQSTLLFAMANEELEVASVSAALAEGDRFYSSIGPVVEASNGKSDTVIKRNMKFQKDYSPVAEGRLKVFEAMAEALPGLDLTCEDIGSVQDMGNPSRNLDLCIDSVSTRANASSAGGRTPSRWGVTLLAIVTAAATLLHL